MACGRDDEVDLAAATDALRRLLSAMGRGEVAVGSGDLARLEAALTVLQALVDAGAPQRPATTQQLERPGWAALLTLMVHGPDPEPTLRGTIRSSPDKSAAELDEDGPASPEDAAELRVWRDGHRLRVEDANGNVSLIVGDDTCWHFDGHPDSPVATTGCEITHGPWLLTRRDPSEFIGDDFTRPTGPVGSTTFLGRTAWIVELAPPAHKPYPIQLTVDAQTGIVLQERNDGFGTAVEWIEFVVGDQLDPDLFRWDGAVRSAADVDTERRRRHEDDLDQRRRWFAEHVTAHPLHLDMNTTVFVHEYDDVSGSFQASLGDGHLGALARRPRSDEPWELHWHDVQHRWSTQEWDWAMTFFQDSATTDGVEDFKRQLGATL
jgi:hypothetical protein